MNPDCNTCAHGRVVLLEGKPPREMLRCMREKTYRSGRISPAGMYGADPAFERDGLPEPQRVDGDKCGPDGKHWRSRT